MVNDEIKAVTVKESIVKDCFVTLFIEVATELAPKFDAVYSIRVKHNDFEVDVIKYTPKLVDLIVEKFSKKGVYDEVPFYNLPNRGLFSYNLLTEMCIRCTIQGRFYLFDLEHTPMFLDTEKGVLN